MNARRATKRVLDVAVAAVGLVVLSPVLLAIAVWLLASGERRVFHVEERVGRGGRPFRLVKFRTLAADAKGPTVAPTGDPRILRPGRILRRTRLDELPQLIHVLAGTMSLVGPRPRKRADLEFVDAATLREVWSVRPGVTGPAAIAGLGTDDALAECPDAERAFRRDLLPLELRLERRYVARWSLRSDGCLLLRTFARLWSPAARRRSADRARRRLAAAPHDPDHERSISRHRARATMPARS